MLPVGTDGIVVRPARADEHRLLSDLALRSKGHWGYGVEFLELCRAELTYSAERCGSGTVFVAEGGGRVLGFHALAGAPPSGELEALFVDPAHIGAGLGGRLLHHALDEAARRGFRRLVLDADPYAEPFYLHHGAHREGVVDSGTLPGRTLPHLSFDLHGKAVQTEV